MSTSKTEMKSKYEMKFSCALVNKTGIKMCSAATPDTQLFGISTSKTTEKSLNNLQKPKHYNTENSACA